MKLFCKIGWQNEARGALSEGTANFSRAFEKGSYWQPRTIRNYYYYNNKFLFN
jgi:hypothetical protein